MLRFQVDPLAGLMGGGGAAGPADAGGPPQTLNVPRQGAPGADAGAGGGKPGPDTPKIASLLNQAADALLQAAQMEKDPEDKAKYMKAASGVHDLVAAGQKLIDTAMGAGPGVKLMRKHAPSGGGGPSAGGGGGY